MSSITFGGVQYTLIKNAIQCRNCDDIIESKKRHEYKECSCGKVAIDGGLDAGGTITGDPQHYTDLGEFCGVINNAKICISRSDLFQLNRAHAKKDMK
jgi:hypothetical protein